ncbi:hypothetical protein BDV09DRAFT_161118 [Aspergillus tetrazonus]
MISFPMCGIFCGPVLPLVTQLTPYPIYFYVRPCPWAATALQQLELRSTVSPGIDNSSLAAYFTSCKFAVFETLLISSAEYSGLWSLLAARCCHR